jgi:hypothetical protein
MIKKYETGRDKVISINVDGYDFIVKTSGGDGTLLMMRSFNGDLIGYDIIKRGARTKYIRHSLLVDLVREYFQRPEHKSWMYNYIKILRW